MKAQAAEKCCGANAHPWMEPLKPISKSRHKGLHIFRNEFSFNTKKNVGHSLMFITTFQFNLQFKNSLIIAQQHILGCTTPIFLIQKYRVFHQSGRGGARIVHFQSYSDHICVCGGGVG